MKWFLKTVCVTALTTSIATVPTFGAMAIDASDWAVSSMEKAYEQHIISEELLSKGTDTITRKEFTELIVQYYAKVTGNTIETEIHNPFWDTDQVEILFAYDKGIVHGKEEHIFAPDSPLTREQMAIMLAELLDKTQITIQDQAEAITFTDIDTLEPSVIPYIQKVQQAGIMQGFEDTFSPYNEVTVQEAVIAFLSLYEKAPVEEETPSVPNTKPTETVTEPSAPATEPTETITEPKQDDVPAEQQQEVIAVEDGIVIDGKTIAIGETVAQLEQDWGDPDRIDQNSYSMERYVYQNDYKHFFMVSLKNNKIVEIFTNDNTFSYNGVTGKTDVNDIPHVKYMDMKNFRVELEDNGKDTFVLMNKDYKVEGIIIRSLDFKEGTTLRYSKEFLEDFPMELMDIINSARVQNGAEPLTEDKTADKVAYAHSFDMYKSNYVGYTNSQGENPFDRLTAGGVNYTMAGENVAKTENGDAIDVYHTWMKEAGTRTNLLNSSLTHYGLSVYDTNFTTYTTLDLFTPANP